MKPFSTTWKQMVDEAFLHLLNKDPKTDALFNPNQQEIVDWWVDPYEPHRVVQILGGERAGKSFLTAYLLLLSSEPSRRKSGQGNLYWIVGPNYVQPRAEFQYLFFALDYLNLIMGEPSMPTTENATWQVPTKWKGIFQTKTSYEISRLASFALDGGALVEAGQQQYGAYLKMLGRLTQTGGPLIVSGTLERTSAWFEDLYERWQAPNLIHARSFALPTWTNTDVYPGGRYDPALREIESEMPPDLFMERFGGQASKPQGLVLKEFSMAENVRHLEYDPEYPVELAIDPGQHCYAVLFIQHVGLITNVLDRVYTRGKIVQEIIPEVMANPLWKHINLKQAGVIDQAGSQHPASYSQVELWQKLAGARLTYHYYFLDDTIAVLRSRIGTSNEAGERLVFFNDHIRNIRDEKGRALDVLAEPLTWRWAERNASKNEPNRPVDVNNDAMKALGYKMLRKYGNALQRHRTPLPVIRIPYWGIPAGY